MAQWFIDSASIFNLEITRSYIGSGSTVFNKENSFLRTSNGVRQGINNEGFGTSLNTLSHIEGYGNTDIAGTTHIEGYTNTASANSAGSHIEGYNNRGKPTYGHIEGVNNFSTEQGNPTLATCHVEGGYNYGSQGWGRNHLEGYNNFIFLGSVAGNHIEGAEHKLGTSSFTCIARNCHIEGYNTQVRFTGNWIHIEGAEHSSSFASTPNWGQYHHIEGRRNAQLSFSNGVSSGNHIEGYNNIISSSDATSVNGNHICGVSCSSYLSNLGSFMNGLGSQTYYTVSYSFTSGQFNSSNLSSYSNISSTTNKIWSNFTIGGGISNSTRATIFEVTLISSGSSIQTFPTRSIILPWVSQSGEFSDDATAAAGGVPLGGFYRTGNNLKIRLS